MFDIQELINNNDKLKRKFKYYSKYGDFNTKLFVHHFLTENTFKICGVYLIKQLTNNRIYIGSTIDILDRWRRHLNALNRGQHECRELQSDFDKYGFADFHWEILCQIHDKTKLIEIETYYIELFCEKSFILYNEPFAKFTS